MINYFGMFPRVAADGGQAIVAWRADAPSGFDVWARRLTSGP